MRRRRPTASAAIVTGIGMIAFVLYYNAMGIYPMRARWWRADRTVVAKEEPAKFRRVVVLTLVLGGGILTWGLLRLRKDKT